MPGDQLEPEEDTTNNGQKRPNALGLGPRKKAYVLLLNTYHKISRSKCTLCFRCFTDPLVHHGRHFGRTVHAMCNFYTLINNGITRIIEQEESDDDISLTLECVI